MNPFRLICSHRLSFFSSAARRNRPLYRYVPITFSYPYATLLFCLFFPATLQADRLLSLPEPLPARVLHVYDGDTLTVELQPTPRERIRISVRLAGIDTPELRGRCRSERRRARLARAALIEQAGHRVILSGIRAGLYYPRRVIATVHDATGRDLALGLIASGHGRPYHGGQRVSWCRSE